MPNFMKISPIGAQSFHAEGQTHVTKLTVAFTQFLRKAPTMLMVYFTRKLTQHRPNTTRKRSAGQGLKTHIRYM